MKSIVLTGGGTAGHCTPNLALLPYLKEHFDKIYYIGSNSGIERNLIENAKIEYFPITTAKLKRQLSLDNLKIPFKIFLGINQAVKILDKLKPDVIFSKGGYVSVPVVIAGAKLKIPVISHESDLTIGLANKITSKYCKKVLTSFPETALKTKNGEHVGPPLRQSLFNVDCIKALKTLGLDGKKPVLLVTGGSQGSKAINDVLRASLSKITEKFDVVHICGKGNLSSINIKGYYQFEYLTNIELAFSVASICISRGGSNTLFELLSLKIPCIVIPLPKTSSRGDQILNANYLKQKGLIDVLPQENLCTSQLINQIEKTYNNRKQIIDNINKNPIENACPKIIDTILKTLEGN